VLAGDRWIMKVVMVVGGGCWWWLSVVCRLGVMSVNSGCCGSEWSRGNE